MPSYKRGVRNQEKKIVPAARRSRLFIAVCVLVAVAVVVLGGLWWGRSRSPLPSPASGGALAPATAYAMLTGRWLRPDGGYIVEIRGVDAAGNMDVAYFNPKSIHIAQAHAALANSVTRVFIELRDVNYPGSTYYLIYDPETDRLSGTYFAAATGETFDVFFVRLKS